MSTRPLLAIALSLFISSCVPINTSYDGKLLPVQCRNNKYGFIDLDGKLVITAKFDSFAFIGDDEYVLVVASNKLGYISLSAKQHIYPQFDFTIPFQEGLAVVMMGGRWGYIDKTGKMVIPLKFDSAREFHNGLAPVEIMGKWGYIDKTGKMVIPLKFDSAKSFQGSIAPVRVGHKWGYIHKTGRVIIPPLLDDNYWIQEISNSTTLVGYIRTSDEFLDMTIHRKFNLVYVSGEFFPSLQTEVKFGLNDKAGKVILPPEYDDIYLPLIETHGLVYTQQNGKIRYLDQFGKLVMSAPDC